MPNNASNPTAKGPFNESAEDSFALKIAKPAIALGGLFALVAGAPPLLVIGGALALGIAAVSFAAKTGDGSFLNIPERINKHQQVIDTLAEDVLDHMQRTHGIRLDTQDDDEAVLYVLKSMRRSTLNFIKDNDISVRIDDSLSTKKNQYDTTTKDLRYDARSNEISIPGIGFDPNTIATKMSGAGQKLEDSLRSSPEQSIDISHRFSSTNYVSYNKFTTYDVKKLGQPTRNNTMSSRANR